MAIPKRIPLSNFTGNYVSVYRIFLVLWWRSFFFALSLVDWLVSVHSQLCAFAFFYIYNRDSAETFVHAFISSRLDYRNRQLFGLPQYQIQKLQRVQNASARLIFSIPRYCHITPLLFDLHWLPVNQRIVFKILLLVYKVLHQLAPSYLVDLISVMPCSSDNLRRNNSSF